MSWLRVSAVLLLAGIAMAVADPACAIPEGPAPGTPEWQAREQANYNKTQEAPGEQGTSPEFQQRLSEQNSANQQSWADRAAADPSWLDPRSGNSEFSPVCTSWMEQCAGDPFRYAGADTFYDNEGELVPFVYYDEGCARISGRAWAPKGSVTGAQLPGVVIETGSVQAPETLYWWMAQALVRQGYVVMTFDVRGQGRSDQQTPDGEQGSNANSAVFFAGLVNAIDFFRSTPGVPYPHNTSCAGTYPTEVTVYNPFFDRIDPARLGIVGHSLGAGGVSAVQGYAGDQFQIPAAGGGNPVDVIVAWDSLSTGAGPGGMNVTVVPRVPAMGHSSEYGLTPAVKESAPDPEEHKAAYALWKDAGVPVFQLTVQGSTHYEWSLIPTFPTSSWCPEIVDNRCAGGWGRPMGEHYSVAWLDRWLKQPDEAGYDNADVRLLADADWCERYSFYYRSARSFPDRAAVAQHSEDIRADCLAGKLTGSTPQSYSIFSGTFPPWLLLAAALQLVMHVHAKRRTLAGKKRRMR